MADDQKATGNDIGGSSFIGASNSESGRAGRKAGRPKRAAAIDPEKLIPAKPGPKVRKHGPAADARREADARYNARRAAKEAGQEIPENPPVRVAKGTSPGYAKRLVKTHEQLALTLDMPEMRIDPSEAKELEENFMIVLADRGITLRSETGNVVALIWCAMTIYGPIMLALWRKFMRDEKTSPALAPATPQQPQQQQSNGAIYTMAPGGFPESEVQILGGGGNVAGALFRSPGDPSNIKPL